MKMRALIVDDEPLAVERMAMLIGRLNDIEVCATAANGLEARSIVEAGGIDLMLLDVEMPMLDGFDLIEELSRDGVPLPCIVLVTAHQLHAATAFDTGVTDFLTKPVRLSRLETAVARVARSKKDAYAVSQFVDLSSPSDARHAISTPSTDDDLWIQRRGEVVRIDLSRIERLQAESEYVRLFIDGTDHLHREALTTLFERLDSRRFIRIHRAHVIDRGSVAALRRRSTGSYQVELRDGTVLPVGRTYRRSVRSLVARPSATRMSRS